MPCRHISTMASARLQRMTSRYAKKALGKIVGIALEKGVTTGIGIGLKALMEIFL